jgi:hypothetical protein
MPGNLVVGERSVGHLTGVEVHLLEQGEAELHQRRAGNLRLDDSRVHRPPQSTTLMRRCDLTWPVSVSTSTSAPAAAHIQNGVGIGREPGRRIGRHVVRLVDAGADDIAGLHAVSSS